MARFGWDMHIEMEIIKVALVLKDIEMANAIHGVGKERQMNFKNVWFDKLLCAISVKFKVMFGLAFSLV